MGSRRHRAAVIVLLLAACSSEAPAVRERSAAAPPATKPTNTMGTTATTSTTSTPITVSVAESTTTTTVLPVTLPLPTLPVPQPPPEPNAQEAGFALGSIEIPRVGLNNSFYEGITMPTFDKGPGHWPGTALPGMLGNVVVGGHRTSRTRPFRHLEQLVPGDEVIFTTDTGRFVYHVTRTEIVTPESIWIADQTNAYTATLFACHPVGSTKERIVVFLELAT
jgi:sortase A